MKLQSRPYFTEDQEIELLKDHLVQAHLNYDELEQVNAVLIADNIRQGEKLNKQQEMLERLTNALDPEFVFPEKTPEQKLRVQLLKEKQRAQQAELERQHRVFTDYMAYRATIPGMPDGSYVKPRSITS